MRHTPLMFALAWLAAASPASAQDPGRRLSVEAGAGYSWPLSEVRDYLGDGTHVHLGVTLNASRIIWIEGLYGFNGLGSKDFTLPVSSVPGDAGVPTLFTADMNIQYGTASVIVNRPADSRIRPYGIVGLGVYYRPVEVTTEATGYLSAVCSPQWYYCAADGFVTVDQVAGKRSSTDFGMVFGGGVNLRVSEAATIYVEARYHYILGPEINPRRLATITGTETVAANGHLLPITFGVRF